MKEEGLSQVSLREDFAESSGMGVSARRRHSFDQYVPELTPHPRRISDIQGKWGSTPLLHSSEQLNSSHPVNVEVQVDELESDSNTPPLDDEDKSPLPEMLCRPDEASSNRNPDAEGGEEEHTSLSRVSSTGFIAMCHSQRLDVRGRFEGWELKRSEIQLKHRLGQGDGGVIHYAKWRGLKCVAKMLRTESENGERPRISPAVARQDLVNEITVLSHLRHPHLVLFLGACSKGDPLIILNEFLPGGNLEEFIHRTWCAKAQWKPSPFQVLQWGIELARALSFLHNCTTPIVHRDLKPANLLLDADLHLKVCDFGLSKLRELRCVSGSYQMTGQTGSLRYMAPEVFQHDPSYDEKVDLYSAGMIMWFVATGVRPFDRCSASSVARKAARDGLRPDLTPVQDKHSLGLAAVISRCWAHAPEQRPSAMQLVRDLELQHSYLEMMGAEGASLPVGMRLEAHALLHQALVGPCTLPQPPLWRWGRFGERAKWRAWRNLEDMRRDVALDHLNLLLDDCCPAWRTKSHRTITTGPDGDRHADPSVARSHTEPLSTGGGKEEGGKGSVEGAEEVASAHSAQTTTSAKSTAHHPGAALSSGEGSGSGARGDPPGSRDSVDRSDHMFTSPDPDGSRRSSKKGSDSSSSQVQEKDIATIAALLDAVEQDRAAAGKSSELEVSEDSPAAAGPRHDPRGELSGEQSSRSLPLVSAAPVSRRTSTVTAKSAASRRSGKSKSRFLGGGWGAMAR